MKEHMLVVDVQAEFHYLAPPGTEQDRIIRAQQNAIASITAQRLLPKFRQMILDEIAGRSSQETKVSRCPDGGEHVLNDVTGDCVRCGN